MIYICVITFIQLYSETIIINIMDTILKASLSNYNNCCFINNPIQLNREITEAIIFEQKLVDCKSIYELKDIIETQSMNGNFYRSSN